LRRAPPVSGIGYLQSIKFIANDDASERRLFQSVNASEWTEFVI